MSSTEAHSRRPHHALKTHLQQRLLATEDDAVTVTLDELDAALTGERGRIECWMVDLKASAAQVPDIEIERVTGEGVTWRVVDER